MFVKKNQHFVDLKVPLSKKMLLCMTKLFSFVMGHIIGIYNVETWSYLCAFACLVFFWLQAGAFQIDFLEFEFSVNIVFYIHSWTYYLIRKSKLYSNFKWWFVLLLVACSISDVDSLGPRARRKRKGFNLNTSIKRFALARAAAQKKWYLKIKHATVK